jgi:hypothetical protein
VVAICITAIDGKTLCGTQNHQPENQPSVHLFSLYECETGLVIGHVVVEKKTNERTGAKALLNAPFLSGKIFTPDAMHMQKMVCGNICKTWTLLFYFKKSSRAL